MGSKPTIARRMPVQESLALDWELGDSERITNSLSHLGKLFEMRGDYQRAEALLEKSLGIYRERGNTRDCHMPALSEDFDISTFSAVCCG